MTNKNHGLKKLLNEMEEHSQKILDDKTIQIHDMSVELNAKCQVLSVECIINIASWICVLITVK